MAMRAQIMPLLHCRYLQAAAALVQYPGASVSRELRRLLAWVPVKRFSAALMRVAVMAWHWVLAAGTPELQVKGARACPGELRL